MLTGMPMVVNDFSSTSGTDYSTPHDHSPPPVLVIKNQFDGRNDKMWQHFTKLYTTKCYKTQMCKCFNCNRTMTIKSDYNSISNSGRKLASPYYSTPRKWIFITAQTTTFKSTIVNQLHIIYMTVRNEKSATRHLRVELSLHVSRGGRGWDGTRWDWTQQNKLSWITLISRKSSKPSYVIFMTIISITVYAIFRMN